MIVNLQEYKRSKEFEDIYQLMFLTQINKIMGVSKDAKNILAKLYCCTRFIEGISNSIFILNELGFADDELVEGKQKYVEWLRQLAEDLENV